MQATRFTKRHPTTTCPQIRVTRAHGAALLLMGLGAAAWINSVSWGKWLVLAGFLSLIVILYYWFGDAIRESEAGLNSKRIDNSYRWG